MGLNFNEIVTRVLIEAVTTDINDPKHWIKKVVDKVNADLRVTISDTDLQKIYRIFGGKPGTYISGKSIIDLNAIAVYDLLHTLLELVYTTKYSSLPWVMTPPADDFIRLVQAQYEAVGSGVQGFIEQWLNTGIDEADYTCTSMRIARAYIEARKELDILEKAAFGTYTNTTILKGLFEVVKKRVSAKEIWRAAALSPFNTIKNKFRLDNITPFQDLITNIMINAPEFAAGATTGTEYKNIIQKIMNLKSTLSGQLLSRLAQEVDELYPRTVVTLCLLSMMLFESETRRRGARVFNSMFSTGGTSGIQPVEPGDVMFTDDETKTKEAFLKFVRDGILDCNVNVMYSKSKLVREINVTSNITYTLGAIDSIQTDEAKKVIKSFKELCVYISTKSKEKTDFAGSLWAASGHSLYGR
jgi:hypothetical protein